MSPSEVKLSVLPVCALLRGKSEIFDAFVLNKFGLCLVA